MDLAITTMGITLQHICHTFTAKPPLRPTRGRGGYAAQAKGETQGITLHPQASHPSLTITMKPPPPMR